MKVIFNELKYELALIAETQEDRNIILAFDESEVCYLELKERRIRPNSVSYTHLTLPTILLV